MRLKWSTSGITGLTRSNLCGVTFCEIEKVGGKYIGAVILNDTVIRLTVAKTLSYCKRKCETIRSRYAQGRACGSPICNPYFRFDG